jgi:predicted porin
MNKLLLTAAIALTLVPSVHAQAAASSGPLSDLTVSGTFDYESQYVFRGKKVTQSAFQPSVNASYPVAGGTANAYVWTSQPIGNNTAGPSSTNEIDIGTFWDHAIPGVDALTGEVGVQMYWYPDVAGVGAVNRSYEFHVGAMYDTTSVLNNYNINPTVMLYHDVVHDSTTLTGAVHYTFDLSDSVTKGLSLTPTFTLGYTSIGRFSGDNNVPQWNNGYTFWQLDVEADYKLNTSTTLYLAGHYAGNNDGSTNGYAGGNPQAPGTDASLWLSLGVKFNM